MVGTLARCPKARDDVVFRQLDDEWVLFDPRGEQLHVLNLMAALVWAHCTGDNTSEEIADALASAFELPVPQQQVLDDVAAAVGRFQETGVLE